MFSLYARVIWSFCAEPLSRLLSSILYLYNWLLLFRYITFSLSLLNCLLFSYISSVTSDNFLILQLHASYKYTPWFIIRAINKNIQTKIIFSVELSRHFWTQPVSALLCLQCFQAFHNVLHFFYSCPLPQNRACNVTWCRGCVSSSPWLFARAHGSGSVLRSFVLHIYTCLYHKYPPLNAFPYMQLIFSSIISTHFQAD